jgi:hypothetical protein
MSERKLPKVGDVVRLKRGGVSFGVEPEAVVVAVRKTPEPGEDGGYDGGYAVTLRVRPRPQPEYEHTMSIAWIDD